MAAGRRELPVRVVAVSNLEQEAERPTVPTGPRKGLPQGLEQMDHIPFKTGDLVRLLCGGPTMVVTRCDHYNAWLAWHDAHNQLQTSTITPDVLVLVDPDA